MEIIKAVFKLLITSPLYKLLSYFKLLVRSLLEHRTQEYIKIIYDDICPYINSNKRGIALLGIPSIGIDFSIKTIVSEHDFFLHIPEHYVSDMQHYRFYSNINHNKVSNTVLYRKLKDFIVYNYDQYCTDEKAVKLIEYAIDKISKQFIDDLNQGKQRSNNIMFGIYDIRISNNSYIMTLFRTDYYTYKIICFLYAQLYNMNECLKIRTLDDFNKICPFVCCCSTGGFVELDYNKVKTTILGKRSSAVACPNCWHMSFDETFDIRDKKINQGESTDLSICVQRGVKEELGLSLNMYKYSIEKSALCIIQTANRCEAGVYVQLKCIIHKRREFLQIINNLHFGSDFDNEYDDIRLIELSNVPKFYKSQNNFVTDEAPIIWDIFSKIDDKTSIIMWFMIKLLKWANN